MAANALKTAGDSAKLSPVVEIALFVAISVALIIPCYWQEHIEAVDLSSHVYNAWLAGELEKNPVPNLTVTQPWTNILSDVAFKWLLERRGPAVAEKVVSATAVLIFFWGAFFLASVTSGRRAWILAPGFAMLTYGLIFHLGFLNFYLSAGFSFWIIGVLWNANFRQSLLAIPLIVLAALSHVMPLAWAGAVLGYVIILRRLPDKFRPIALVAGIAIVVLAQAAVTRMFPVRHTLEEFDFLVISGIGQVKVFDAKYLIVAAGLLAVWCALFLERLDVGKMLGDPLVHLWILQMAACVVMPNAIWLPGYKHALSFIPERISVFNFVMVCAVLGRARYGRGMTRITAAVATIFFTFLYIDEATYARLDRKVGEIARQVPRGSRFVAEISDSNSHLSPLLHSADWACIGHCFSYANYEPATGQFRIQVDGPNPVTAPSMEISQAIEEGTHVITPQEAPIYSVCRCEEQNPPLCLRRLEAGEKTCSFSLPIVWTVKSFFP